MKKIVVIGLVILVAINLVCVRTVYKIKRDFTNLLTANTEAINQKLSKIDGLLADVDAVKQAFGWKTVQLTPTDCMTNGKYLTEGPFSFVTKSDSELKCYAHEFTRLNKMVKSLELFYDENIDNFSGIAREMRAEGIDFIRKYGPPDKQDDLKSSIKGIIKKLNE